MQQFLTLKFYVNSYTGKDKNKNRTSALVLQTFTWIYFWTITSCVSSNMRLKLEYLPICDILMGWLTHRIVTMFGYIFAGDKTGQLFVGDIILKVEHITTVQFVLFYFCVLFLHLYERINVFPSQVNGKDVQNASHETVVSLIKALLCDLLGGNLRLFTRLR